MMNLLGRAEDKEFWAEVRTKECYKPLVEKLKKNYDENMATGDLLNLKYSEFKLFWTTGNRTIYEKQFNIRRARANRAALLALIYPEEQEYIDVLMDSVYAICDEYSWCLPAHHGKLEVNDNARIDLTGATTAAQLAEIYLLLGDRMEPLINNRIKAEIDRRIVATFCPVEHYWWEGGTMNWTAVCVGSVARALMIVRPDIMTDDFIKRTMRSMDSFLTGFDSKGICYEGTGYWSYGFGHFVTYADMLRRFTDGKYNYFERDKVRYISAYYQKMFLSGNIGVSFSDGGPGMSYPVYLLHFLKTEYPDDVLVYDPRYGYLDDSTIRNYCWYNDEYTKNPASDKEPFELYAEEAQWMIKKTAAYGFAAKGGDNNEFHNHNDVGSFIFAKEGRHIFTDPGGGQYTRQYFAADTRYTMVECSSRGHSVPMIGDVCQSFGKTYKANDAKYENGVFSLDLAGAYVCDGLKSIKRSFKFDETTVTLTDTFDYKGSEKIIQRLATRYQPETVNDGEIKVDCGGVKYDPAICTVNVSQEPLSKGGSVYFIDFILNDGVRSSTVTIY